MGTLLLRITILWLLALSVAPATSPAMELSNTPMESSIHSLPADLILVLDNSGSMDWEFMTPEIEGLFQERLYLFGDNAYLAAPDHQYGLGHSLTPSERHLWRSQWAGYNRIYFDPNDQYLPWPDTDRYSFSPAPLHQPWSDPIHTDAGDAVIDLSALFFSVQWGVTQVTILNAHYFTHVDANGNGLLDSDENIYLITWVDEDNDGQLDISNRSDADYRKYYRFVDDGDHRVEDNELVPVVDEIEKEKIRPAVTNAKGRFVRYQTDGEALQNFANWCSYYRRRSLTLKASVAHIVRQLGNVNLGVCAVHGDPRLGVQPLSDDRKTKILNAIYAMSAGGLSPLRLALDQVGRYFRSENAAGFDEPYNEPATGGHCQRHLALVVSDGFWNGSFSGVGNADGGSGAPYADDFANTLADVAMDHHAHQQTPDDDDVSIPMGCEDAASGHLITLALSFGLNGTIDRTDIDGNGVRDLPGYHQDPCFSHADTPQPGWLQPVGVVGYESGHPSASREQTAGLLDDLWHASINGRGTYFSMEDTSFLTERYFAATYQTAGPITAAATALRQDPQTAAMTLYRASFDPTNWQGDVTARAYHSGSAPGTGQLLWRASDQYQSPGLDPDARCIFSYGGLSSQPRGIAFRLASLSSAQQHRLGAAMEGSPDFSQRTRDLMAYLRGASLPQFRQRSSQLGDVVHSGPVVVDNTLFVGANNGMLHALNATSGEERFAYVPNLVLDGLKALSDPGYVGWHQFYVDGPLWVGEVQAGEYRRHTYLVGGLGKGGQGYFCLLAASRHRSSQGAGHGPYQWDFHVDHMEASSGEAMADQVVAWEYPPPDPSNDGMDNDNDGDVDEMGESDPHMGHTFGQAYAVNANAPNQTHQPVVIFGNGYGSASQSAVFYVLNAQTGKIVRKIDTGAAVGNGLSTPALVDVDRDNRIDYAYAGDLMGNLWKFDLRAEDSSFWGVAYGEDRNGDGVIDAAQGDLPQPLFQARGQPITGRPDVMAMAHACDSLVRGYMVVFGTGRYVAMEDQGDIGQQSIYGLWDYGDDGDNSEYLGEMADRSTGRLSSGFHLVRQSVTGQDNEEHLTRRISRLPVKYLSVEDQSDPDQIGDPADHVGWFLDFPTGSDPWASPGERVTGRVTLRGGKAVVISVVPEQALCRSGGNSWIYILNGCDGSEAGGGADATYGARYNALPIFAEPFILKDADTPHMDQILVPDASGRIIKLAFIGEPWGKAYWWQNIE